MLLGFQEVPFAVISDFFLLVTLNFFFFLNEKDVLHGKWISMFVITTLFTVVLVPFNAEHRNCSVLFNLLAPEFYI
jgi:hypothetical protein